MYCQTVILILNGDCEKYIPDIWVKIHNEMVVEMYSNSLGYIYGTKDIDNMVQLYMNRSEQHKVQKASKDTHRKV